MANLLYIQFADTMFKRHDVCDSYFDSFYNKWKHVGYCRPKHTFELPKWIAEISYFIPDNFMQNVYYSEQIPDTLNTIINKNPDYVLFSLMNCNQDFIYEIVKELPQFKFLIGGYNEQYLSKLEKDFTNVIICKSTKTVADELNIEYKFGTDYSLFKGESTIPRITMSYGCLNKCKFCIVPHGKIYPVDNDIILQQVNSFKPLDYSLIYVDDKTFGQSQNYHYIKELCELIRKDNHNFNGFIVQTTAPMLVGKAEKFADIGVKVAEIGLETYNDNILRAYNKPCSEKVIDMAVNTAYKNKIKLIANLIIGLPEETEETYQRTFDYVMPLLKEGKLIGINPAIYTDYSNENNLGEIDFIEDEKTELHRKWWGKFNFEAEKILSMLSVEGSINYRLRDIIKD